MLLPDTMKEIVRLGGGLDIDSGSILPGTAKEIARMAGSSGATVIFRNPKWLPDTLKEVGRLSAGNVIFRFDA